MKSLRNLSQVKRKIQKLEKFEKSIKMLIKNLDSLTRRLSQIKSKSEHFK
ncbi:hypothetical protein EW15_0362 [Prochlorococcus sp. MIT 0801]|nr:hypothetical protein EW15_0362 [Prochlorococcus sp. MIT 0801]